MALVISADEIKKQLLNYSPDKAESFHSESAKQADKLFTSSLKHSPYKKVILLNGGAASGKTEFLSTQLNGKKCIIFDATLSTELGAEIKIKKIIEAKKIPVIYTVIPDDLQRAFIAFLHRDRKFSDEHFYKTHSGSRKTILWITKNYPEIEINIIESSYVGGKLQFLRLQFDTRQKLIDYLAGKQLSEDDIIAYVIKK
jgi:hypothetical protein